MEAQMNYILEAGGADPDSQTRSGRGGKLVRSVTVTVRLDPRLHYLAELAARTQRRTLSSFIEWSIEDTLKRVNIFEGVDQMGNHLVTSFSAAATELWDVDEADRFAKLAFHYPDMLNHTEQVAWKLIRENGFLWRGSYNVVTNRWTWTVKEGSLIAERLRQHWDIFNKVSRGEAAKSELPKWAEQKPQPQFRPPDDDDPPDPEDDLEDLE
jgi:hypothetical protein